MSSSTSSDRSIEAAGLGNSGGSQKLDVLMERVGVIMLPAGLVLILLGWRGAASTPFGFEQIPYMISGGLLGLGMMVSGGLIYLASWIARLVSVAGSAGSSEAPDLSSLQSAVLSALSGVAVNGSAPVHADYVATPNGTMFHRPDCAIVASRDDVRAVDPDAESGFRPCGMCDPLAMSESV